MLFSAIGQHALAELIDRSSQSPITYDVVSRKTGDFKSLSFKTRDDYIQLNIPADAIQWDDNDGIQWDNNDFIEWDE